MTLEESERYHMLKTSVEELYEQLEWMVNEFGDEVSAPDRLGIHSAMAHAQVALGIEGVLE
jgi:hypothetical protein